MKKLNTILLAFLLLSLLLCGCGEVSSGTGSGTSASTTTESGIQVYYVNADGNRSLSTGYELTATGDASIQELFEILKNGQFTDGKPAVPTSVNLELSGWQEHSLVLYLSGEYPTVGTVEELLCRYSIVMTMFQLEDVEGVTIYVDDHALTNSKGVEIGVMNPETFISDVGEAGSSPEEREITLYFANEAGDQLLPYQETLVVNSSQSLEKQIVLSLIKGPSSSTAQATIPSGTSLLSISVREEICYVNLSENFVPENKDSATWIPIYSLVNSLTELDTISAVQFMIAGSTDVDYGNEISLAAPIERNLDLVQQTTETPEETTAEEEATASGESEEVQETAEIIETTADTGTLAVVE